MLRLQSQKSRFFFNWRVHPLLLCLILGNLSGAMYSTKYPSIADFIGSTSPATGELVLNLFGYCSWTLGLLIAPAFICLSVKRRPLLWAISILLILCLWYIAESTLENANNALNSSIFISCVSAACIVFVCFPALLLRYYLNKAQMPTSTSEDALHSEPSWPPAPLVDKDADEVP